MTIDITDAGGDNLGSFGITNTPIFGQTFTTPDATNIVLSEFDFQITLASVCTFTFYVYQFDTGTLQVTGSPLYTSSSFTPSGSLQLATFTPNLTLNSSNTYIALALADAHGGGSGTFKCPAGANTTPDPDTYDYDLYANGAFYFRNDTNVAGVFIGDFLGVGGDIAFKAVFGTSSPSIINSFEIAGD